MLRIHDDMKQQIKERNAVLMKLNQCTRQKDQDGEPAIPQTYKDIIIGPYLREVLNLQGTVPRAFKLFAGGFLETGKTD